MEYNGNPESVGYKIKYSRSDGHGKTLSHVVQDRVEREYTIEDLEEWTEYRVQVQAFNAIGSGPWSQTVVGRTRESGTDPLTPSHPAASSLLGLCALRAIQGRARLKLLFKHSLSSFPLLMLNVTMILPHLPAPATSLQLCLLFSYSQGGRGCPCLWRTAE